MGKSQWIAAGLLALAMVDTGFGQTATSTQAAFTGINLTDTPVQAEPMAMDATDMASLRTLSDAQLAAFVTLLDVTPLLLADDLPRQGRSGTFYSLQHPEWPPLPCNVRGIPVWPMNNFYLLNDLECDYTAPVISLQAGLRAMALSSETSSGNGDSGIYLSEPGGYMVDTNGLWLEITNVANGLAYVNLHHATNQVYEILTKTNLLAAEWNIDQILFWPDLSLSGMPFTVPTLNQETLFVRAMDWTGVDGDGDGLADWWEWQHFGRFDLTATNLDADGNTLLDDYNYYTMLAVFHFYGLVVSNSFSRTNLVALPLKVAGYPYSCAVLVDDVNPAHAVWQPYGGPTVTADLGSTPGWHDVRVGLRDHEGETVWQWGRLNLDTTPPSLAVTNPATGTVAVPQLQLQGWVDESLGRLTFDVSNATGIFTGQTGYTTPQYYDTNRLLFTTHSFQCYDLPLADGWNTITLHATDLAGNVTTTNYNVLLDVFSVTNAPVTTLGWPPAGTPVGGSNFVLQAFVNDPTATVLVTIVDASGHTNVVLGTVDRDGRLVVNGIPLGGGANSVTVSSTGANGSSSTTNFTILGQEVGLTMDPLTTNQLNQARVTVSGHIDDGDYTVTVNGVLATIVGDPVWTAVDVPVSPTGAASFYVEVRDGQGNLVAVQTFSQPQPVTVVLSSYDARVEDWTYGFDCPEQLLGYNTDTHWRKDIGGVRHEEEVKHCDSPLNVSDTTLSTNEFFQQAPWLFEEYFETGPGYYLIYQDHPRMEVSPGGAGGNGPDPLYLVRAAALEIDEYPLMQPLPPEWLQINGQALVNGGLTNWNWTTEESTAFWGEMLIAGKQGVPVDVTPTATQFSNLKKYFFDVQADEVILQPAVDANRDGDISFDAPDRFGPDHTTAAKPYRFWVNDDQDDTASGETVPVTAPDYADNQIKTIRDLEDFARLNIQVQNLTNELVSGIFKLGIKWKSISGGAPAIKLFRNLSPAGGAEYLTDTNVATDFLSLQDPGYVSGSGTYFVSPAFWQSVGINTTNNTAYLLFEGCAAGKGQLVLTVNKADGIEVAEAGSVWIELKNIKEMYQRAAATPSSDVFAPPYNQSSSAYYTNSVFDESGLGFSNGTSIAFDKPQDETPQCVVFVHGWRMPYEEYVAFSETMFKRLWWQGYKGRLCAFYWETLTSPFSYNDSEFRAWKYGLSLKKYVESLKANLPGYSMNIAAHSMGNIVTGSALYRGLTIDNYALLQAAVPAGCYDASSTVNSYSRFTGAESTSPTPDAASPDMGYRGYLANVTGNLVNFYNPFDFALATGTADQLSTWLPFLWWFDTNWEANEESYKPVSLGNEYYAYDSSQTLAEREPLWIPGNGPGGHIISRYVSDPQESMSFVARPRSKAVGALADVGGTITSQVDLNARFGFDDKRDEHSAEFNWNIQRLNGATGFYHTLYDLIR